MAMATKCLVEVSIGDKLEQVLSGSFHWGQDPSS